MSRFARYEPGRPAGVPRTARDTFIIRPAEVRDAEALAQIYTEREGIGDVRARRQRFEDMATSDDQLLLVAEREGSQVGYGRVAYHPGSMGCPPGWYLIGLIVSTEFRRRGIGEALTRERLDWIAARAGKAFYVANESNRATIDLHARLGFQELTREFRFPGIDFQGGRGILFAADVAGRRT